MSYTCKLETGEYDIASTVDEKLLGVFPGPPRPVDPILVDTRPVKFFVEKFEGDSGCTYTIRVSEPSDGRYLRNVDGTVSASADDGIPQRWVISTYGEGTYT
ncbi:hypothetical protein SCLCIDRAFT_12182 [Scleroderma citrinum Foug A]|uniref:Uncharacterized protein n=1 Tax=Scleroderma citrinum Foug A TaxID=1036808 RepID=A0A0C3D543_9AGAM|nr:hypothetical protein SCLCIDRAFT_12182 [Scleroderma citrinum Foug A]